MPRLPRYAFSLLSIHFFHGIILFCGAVFLFQAIARPAIIHAEVSAAHRLLPVQAQPTARTASPHIGSAMAVLATLQDADVLPPEGTRDATRIVRFVIQFQSVFTKSEDPAVQAFASQALAAREETHTAETIDSLRTTGWTAEALERLSDAEAQRPPEELQELATGFASFNLSVGDFHTLMQLVRDARQAFHKRGLEFQQMFASRRKEMPGAGQVSIR